MKILLERQHSLPTHILLYYAGLMVGYYWLLLDILSCTYQEQVCTLFQAFIHIDSPAGRPEEKPQMCTPAG
jgi:hypothetical protein